jgi:alpha-galactosidase
MPGQSLLHGRIKLHPDKGALSIAFPGQGKPSPGPWTLIRSATASVDYRIDGTPHQFVLAGPQVSFGAGENLVTISHHNHHLRLDWNWAMADDELESWLEVTNHGKALLTVDRLNVLRLVGAGSLDLPGLVADWRFYQNGWQSWSPTGVRRVGDGPFPTPPDDEYRLKNLPHGDGLRSEWVTVIAATSQPAETTPESPEPYGASAHLLIGFVTGADQLAEIILDADEQFHALTATCHTDGISLDRGQSLRSERLRVASGLDGWGSLEAWADRMGELIDARIPQKTPTGWCTWNYYSGFDSAQDVYANLGAIRRQRLPLDFVMIDQGYQAAIGDWLTTDPDRFTDMTAVAATIRREGRVPGIWTAPFGLAVNSQTWASHPAWVVRDEAGEPVFAWSHSGRPVYALDTTHPEAADWLHTTFRTMRQEWGYDAFKVDCLFAAALPGQRHASQVTRAQALRRGLALIRDAIGDDALLLACGAPMGPAVGLVDGMRLGPDIGRTWEPLPADKSSGEADDLSATGTTNALRNSIARAFTHRRLWVADPDCLLLRPQGDRAQLTLYETRTLATVFSLTGGMLVNSDRVGDLPPSRLAILRQTLPPTDQIAYRLDLFECGLPEILVLPIERPWGRWWLVGLINWDSGSLAARLELETLGLPAGRYHVYDQWRAEYLGQTDGSLALPRQRPHETLLLLVKPVTEQPDWLTSTFHLGAGSVEVVDVIRQKLGERRLKLLVYAEKEGENFGRLVFTLPAGWVVLDAQVNGRRRSVNIRDQQARLVDMGFTLRDRAWVLVDCARV